MGSIDQRRMEAEAAANQHIEVKDYQHTTAYSLLAGEDTEAIRASMMTGKEINDRLMQRARTYVHNQAAIRSYQNSHLGSHNFRTEQYTSQEDEKTKKTLVEKQLQERTKKQRNYIQEKIDAKRNQENKLDATYIDKRKSHWRGAQADHETSPHELKKDNNQRTGIRPYNNTGYRAQRQRPEHHFADRSYRNYNPYA